MSLLPYFNFAYFQFFVSNYWLIDRVNPCLKLFCNTYMLKRGRFHNQLICNYFELSLSCFIPDNNASIHLNLNLLLEMHISIGFPLNVASPSSLVFFVIHLSYGLSQCLLRESCCICRRAWKILDLGHLIQLIFLRFASVRQINWDLSSH